MQPKTKKQMVSGASSSSGGGGVGAKGNTKDEEFNEF